MASDEAPHVVRQLRGRPRRRGAGGPALLQRRVVQIRIRVGVQDLVREHDGSGVSRATRRILPLKRALETTLEPWASSPS